MISSTSLRSPQKTCGLFDIGFAGGDADVTSLDLNAPVDNNPFSLNYLKSASFATSDPVAGGDAYTEGKIDCIQQCTMDTFDMLDPLADLETDQLMDDSLDAFINLDQFLMGETFFDDVTNVKELTNAPTIDNMTLTAVDSFFLSQEPAVTKSRKRKAGFEALTAKPIKTSMFEIPVLEKIVPEDVNPQIDHDYTAKHLRMSTTSEDALKHSNNSDNINKHKSVAKAKFIQCKPSTSSDSMFSLAEDTVTDKHTMRRIKNNVASKKSREQRKQKFADLDLEASLLIEANEKLRQKIVELEKASKEMKAMLVSKMIGK